MRLSLHYLLCGISFACAAFGQPAGMLTVVNSATYEEHVALAPGMLATAFGEFAGVTEAVAPAGEDRRTLGNAQVLVHGTAARLLYVSARQINFVVPDGVRARDFAGIAVTMSGTRVAETAVRFEQINPVLFVRGNGGARPALALMPNQQVNDIGNRARTGERVTLAVTGFPGEADLSGAGVMVGLEHVRAERVRRDAAMPGLWLVDFIMPERSGTAAQVPVAVHAAGAASNTVSLWVE